jgi:AraC-like DNA-binding protein
MNADLNIHFNNYGKENIMAVQFYVKQKFTPGFEKQVRLLYVCKADQQQTSLPTVLHSHEDRLELVYLYNGQGIHTIGGNLYHTKQGNLLIYNSGVIHDECATPDVGMCVYNCAVSGLKLLDLPDNHLIAKGICPVLDCGPHQETIENLFQLMHQQISEGYESAEAVCNYLLRALLMVVLNQIDFKIGNNEIEEHSLQKYIKEYIDAHYLEELTLSSLCKALHMSPSYLSHLFKQETGFAPIQYIMRRRIGKAQSLLISTDYSVTLISSMIGYDHPSYFNDLFKKTVGMSPKKYRQYYIGRTSCNQLKVVRGLKRKMIVS